MVAFTIIRVLAIEVLLYAEYRIIRKMVSRVEKNKKDKLYD